MKINIIVGILSIIVLVYIIRNEYKRSAITPLCFSEISQLEREYGSNLDPITEYYAKLNDGLMNIFEAYNKANMKEFPDPKAVATELEYNTEITFKIHRYNIPLLLTNIPELAGKALNRMSNVVQTYSQLSKGFHYLSQTWDEDHDDIYHTEIYTYTTTDSKGNTTTHTGTRQVYDYTIHTYNYNSGSAFAASELLQNTFMLYPSLTLDEIKVLHFSTGAEGEYAVEQSWKDVDGFNKTNIVNIIKSFSTRPTYSHYRNKLITEYPKMVKFLGSFQSSLQSARSVKYRTYSHYDSGPKEFRIWKEMVGHVGGIVGMEGEILNPIIQSSKKCVQLYSNIVEYINTVLDKGKQNNKLKNSIINDTRQLYIDSFKGSFDIDLFRVWVIVFWILGLIIVNLGMYCIIKYEETL